MLYEIRHYVKKSKIGSGEKTASLCGEPAVWNRGSAVDQPIDRIVCGDCKDIYDRMRP